MGKLSGGRRDADSRCLLVGLSLVIAAGNGRRKGVTRIRMQMKMKMESRHATASARMPTPSPK
jgi:hypothetical protein